jgi:hypothetical protein
MNNNWIYKLKNLSIVLFFLFSSLNLSSQNINIFDLMERTDLTLDQVERIANDYFKIVGKERGTGHKQYQRWLYERKFHSDVNGYFIKPELEFNAYKQAKRNMLTPRGVPQVWSELGPKSWTYTSGWNPGVGRITSVAVHPSDTTVIYVSSPGGGIWKSTNSGSSWTPLIDAVNSAWMSIYNLRIDPNNQSVIYAAVTSGGVLKSSNAGATWSATGAGPSVTKKVLVHPSNSNIVFCTANNGIFRSTNAGTNWTQVHAESKEDIEFNPANANIMYASGSGGTSCVWRSADNGVTWTAITSGNGITNAGRTLLGVSPANANIVYAVQASGSLFGRMYKSTDGGVTYTTTVVGSPASGTNFFGYEPSGTGTSGQATYDMAICVNPTDATEVHIAGIICWKSNDGGFNFTAETVWSYPNGTGYNHADVHALEWVNKTIYSGSDGGVYKSINNGGDFTDLTTGLGIKQIYRISCAKTDANVMTLGAQDNGSSFRRTAGNWVDWLGADGMDNVLSTTNAAVAYGTSQYGAIYKTVNSGASRTSLSQPSSGNWITPLAIHPTNQDTFYGGWVGVWRSGNAGASWTNLSPGIGSTLDVLAVASSNTQYIYASTGSTLYRTSNGGAAWTSIAAPATITSIFVSKYDPNKIWMTGNSTSNRVYVSTDAGTTWTNLSTGLPTVSARSVVVDEDASETIYVGMNIGVYYRDNINNTWAEHGTGLPLVAINEVEFQKSGNKLRVATYGRGVWESPLQNIATPCDAPTGLASSSITTTSALVSWTAASGAVSYKVDYKLSTDTGWTVANAALNATSMTLSSLTPNSAYNWRVRTNCSVNTSVYSSANFNTLGVCNSPIGLNTTSITTSSATLNWSAVSGATNYKVDYKLSTDTTWIVLNAATTSTSASLSGLSSFSNYDWRVQTNCTSGTSSFAQSSFTTLSSCTAPGSLATTSITTNSATINWGSAAGAASYRVEYKARSAGSWTLVDSTTTSTTAALSGLSSATQYDWRVRTNCSPGYSSYTQDSFTTLIPCGNPATLNLDSSTSSSAMLTWAAVSGANNYAVDYKLKSSGTWISTAGTTSNSITISGLSEGSYDWRVMANCTSGSGAWVSSSFLIYCGSSGTNSATSYIDRVSIGTIYRLSGNDGGYYDATAYSMNVKPGQNYSVSVSPGYPGAKKNTYWSLFVDLNQDGDFADAGELISTKSYKGIGNTNLNLNMPNTATLGYTRMRVSFSLTTKYPSYCGSVTNGEVEDYTLFVTNTPNIEPGLLTQDPVKSFSIYPNPSQGNINVSYTLMQDEENLDLKIFDLTGKIVYSKTTNGLKGENSLEIDLAKLNNGVYFLQFTDNEEMRTGSFVIHK